MSGPEFGIRHKGDICEKNVAATPGAIIRCPRLLHTGSADH